MEETNIVYLNSTIRTKLELIEKDLKDNDLIPIIKNDDKLNIYMSVIIGDAYVLLNHKNKNSIITPIEKETLNAIINAFATDFSSIYLDYQNRKEIFNVILKNASDFRKFNSIGKSKLLHELKTSDQGLLSINGYQIKSDLKEYDLNKKSIEGYVKTFESKSDDLEAEIFNYLSFINLNNEEVFKNIKRELIDTIRNSSMLISEEKFDEDFKKTNEYKTKPIDLEFIRLYIDSVINIKNKQLIK